MNQNINLYQVTHRRSVGRGGFGAHAVTIVWGITLLFAAVTQFLLHQHNRGIRTDMQLVQQDIADAEKKLNEVAAARMSGTDPLMEARLNELLRELDMRETILGLVSGDSAGDSDGFSEQMRSLARQNVEGVWLTRIRITSPGARTTLEGRALSPEAVPLYLRQLSAEVALAGQGFDVFQIQRPEEAGEPIRFSLNRRDNPELIRLVRE